jgi:release factor glutamine methyltransferase
MRPALVVRRAADYLARHEVDAPLPTAEALLRDVLGTDRAGLYAREDGLSSAEARRFGRALCRRCVGEPTQHITGEQGFRRLILEVRPGVFVPRPETEVVVDQALAAIAGLAAPVVVDVGTGSGAIALAVRDERHDARVIAIDASREAVSLARANAERLALPIDVLEGDLLEPLRVSLRGEVDLVVSNPPYIAEGAVASLPREVRADPRTALVGGAEVYGRLFEQARDVLRAGAAIVVEIEETRGEEIRGIACAAGFTNVEVAKDLTGRDRVLTAWEPA